MSNLSIYLLILSVFIFCGIYADPDPEPERIEQYENYHNEIYVEDEDADDKTRNAIQSPLQRWPSNKLYYLIAKDYTPKEAQNVRTALDVFNTQTCLTFEELPNASSASARRYLNYRKSKDMCGTRVGYNPVMRVGPHDIHMNSYCLNRTGVIQHETLHVLGLFHEQSRPDRDEYVAIDFDNIERKYWSQFMAQKEPYATTYEIPYDYDSVMHYSQFAFAKDRSKPTIRAWQNGELVEREMGQVKGPSERDLEKIRIMYKCNGN